MRYYNVNLQSSANKDNYFIKRACSSVNLDADKKLIHNLEIKADFETPFNICLIHGLSGSGKTTLTREIFGQDCFKFEIDEDKSVIEQFDKSFKYDERVEFLVSIGLGSIPEWIKPIKVLSNGERARAEIAILLSKSNEIFIDEFTSVLDRNIAKILSHSLQKFARKQNKRIILCSVHEDVTEWLNPDIIVDVNKQEYIDRRGLWQGYKRNEFLNFEIRAVSRSSWKMFSKYHYLSDNLPSNPRSFGLFINNKQIGFQCFANYNIANQKMLHSNRTIIHPEYIGLGLGIRLITETSRIMIDRGYEIRAKFSNISIYRSMMKDPFWKYMGKSDNFNTNKSRISKKKSGLGSAKIKAIKQGVVSYSFKFIG